MSQPTIRLATPADLDAILVLEREASAAAHWPRAYYEQIFQPDALYRLCLVAGPDEVQGFLVAQVAGPDWELENIVISPPARRRGLATQLVDALLDRARQQHVPAIFLEVRESNVPARGLYRRCGFVELARRPAYYRHPEEAAILYKFSFIR